MKSNLYIFATGGTGSQVIKALIMLLAAGVKIDNIDTIIPIIIDPHFDNHALERTVQLIEIYQEIRRSLKEEPKEGDFFYTKIMSLKQKTGRKELKDKFTFDMISDDQKSNRFKDYINYAELSETDKLFVNLLFSELNLNMRMTVGFVGNPNVGSIVLNQIEDSEEFNAFASSFNENDRIFIISSIFGGTGASAFPILLKNIRGCQVGQHEFVRKAMLGALTVMPYFKVGTPKGGEALINENTFKSKTKAALHYYLDGVNPYVDRLYGIADRAEKSYDYDPGFNKQKNNDAHYIELIAATAVFNFMQATPVTHQERKAMYLEFGLSTSVQENSTMTFRSLPSTIRTLIEKPLSKLAFMMRHLEHIDQSNNHSAAWTKSKNAHLLIDNSFKGKDFYGRIKQFLRAYETWLTEMARNERSFKPFHLDEKTPLNKTINEIKIKDVKNSLDYDSLDQYLTEESDKTNSFPGPEDKLMKVFAKGLQTMLETNY